jgi:ATP-dependent DNA helicase RecG
LTINELLHIIAQGENEQTEFKQSFNRQTIETLVTFANNKGGTIVIGMSDSGAITGTEITPESIQNWQNEIKLKTQPALTETSDTFKKNENIFCKVN